MVCLVPGRAFVHRSSNVSCSSPSCPNFVGAYKMEQRTSRPMARLRLLDLMVNLRLTTAYPTIFLRSIARIKR